MPLILHVDSRAMQSISSLGQGKWVYAWYSFVTEAPRRECYNGIYKRKKEMASLFLTLPACSHCDSATGPRDCAAENPYYDFVRFQTKLASTLSLPITFGNELRTNDMIPYSTDRCFAQGNAAGEKMETSANSERFDDCLLTPMMYVFHCGGSSLLWLIFALLCFLLSSSFSS